MSNQLRQDDFHCLQRLRAILDNACDAFLIHDQTGCILEVNQVLCDWLGYTKAELLNLTIADIDEKFDQSTVAVWNKSIGHGGSEHVEGVFRKKDGTTFPVVAKVSSFNEDGQNYLFLFVHNCSSNSHQFISPGLTQYALDNAANPTFWYKVSDPVFFYVNQATCEYLGYAKEELLTMWPGDINPTYTMGTLNKLVKDLKQHDHLLFETHHITKSNAIVPVEVLVRMVRFEGEDYIISFVRDISKRKKSEQELKIEKEKAEQANNAKSAFLANMSHEIRTPLTAIIGFADTALHENKSIEQRMHALRTIKQSGKHLLHLISDVLDFSKIEANEMDIEKSEIYLLELISAVESIIGDQAKRKGLDFKVVYEYPLPGKINTDELRLKQILLNLCNNAVKFTDAGSVQLRIECDVSKYTLSMQVIDTGIGLSQEQIDKVFLPFKQGDAGTARKYGGTGLGLSLSIRLAELMGVKLTAASELGKGSVFHILLPLSLEESATDNIIVNKPQRKSVEENYIADTTEKLSGSILLAEDDVFNQELITIYLEDMGANVTLAENGMVAFELASKQNYDLIYMDMQMPLLSGYEVVKKLRALNYAHPIVMLTANATLEDRQLCKKVGCDDFVTKPIDEKKLYAVTARYLKISE